MKVSGTGFSQKNSAPRKTGLLSLGIDTQYKNFTIMRMLSFFAHEMIKKIVQIFIQPIH